MQQQKINYTNLQVAVGVIRIPSKITGMQDGSFARKNEFLRPGDAIPEGMLSDREIKTLLASGTIKEIATPRVAEAAQQAARKHMSKWSVDPASLGNKTFEDLLVMIQDIDPQFPLDKIADDAAARRQLTRDFDPEFRENQADVLARDPVSRLTTEGVKDGDQGSLSDRAAENLAELQARAETPEAKGEVGTDTSVIEEDGDGQSDGDSDMTEAKMDGEVTSDQSQG